MGHVEEEGMRRAKNNGEEKEKKKATVVAKEKVKSKKGRGRPRKIALDGDTLSSTQKRKLKEKQDLKLEEVLLGLDDMTSGLDKIPTLKVFEKEEEKISFYVGCKKDGCNGVI